MIRAIAIAPLLVLAACSSGPDPEVARLQTEVSQLRTEVQETRNMAASNQQAAMDAQQRAAEAERRTELMYNRGLRK